MGQTGLSPASYDLWGSWAGDSVQPEGSTGNPQSPLQRRTKVFTCSSPCCTPRWVRQGSVLLPCGVAGQVTLAKQCPAWCHFGDSIPGSSSSSPESLHQGVLPSFPTGQPSPSPPGGCSTQSPPGWAAMASCTPARGTPDGVAAPQGNRLSRGGFGSALPLRRELARGFVLCPVYPAKRNRGVQCAGISRPRPAAPPHESC